jgi:hypothetical protein
MQLFAEDSVEQPNMLSGCADVRMFQIT